MTVSKQDQDFLKTLTVLFVEDDEDARDQFTEFLTRPVGKLITAANGAEGLEAFHRYRPQIVVTDIQMPVMDGLAMAMEIRETDPAVPIIVVTAFEQTNYLRRAINIGIDKYVTKPVNSYLLYECLLDCAHRQRAEEQLILQRQREIELARSRQAEIVGDLAAGMAHDYNNLLQMILGFVTLAKTCAEPGSPCFKYLETAEECSGRAQELGQVLRIMGKGSDSRAMRLPSPLNALITHVVDSMVDGTPVVCTFDLVRKDPPVNFISDEMTKVFSALTANALEAMPNGGTLLVRSAVHPISETDHIPLPAGDYLHISFTDTGEGVSAEILPKIFNPYFSTKNRCSQKGMGLSLALCHTIISKHGGTISAESLQNKGTTIHIWLPVAG